MTGPADPAAARREAEEALKAHDVAVAGDEWAFAPISLDVADALRALLAEPQEPAPTMTVPNPASGGPPLAVEGVLWLAVCALRDEGHRTLAAEVDSVRQSLPSAATSPAVREAAEAVEAALPAVRRYQRVPLPLSSDHAAMSPGACDCRWHVTDRLLWSVDALLAALSASRVSATAATPDLDVAAGHVRKLTKAMQRWGSDEDGIPAEGFDAYNEAAPVSWPERHAAELRAACGNPENWPQCVAGDWIETMVQTAGWVCGKCGHQPGHPCHNGTEKPRVPAPPAAPAPDAVRVAAEIVRERLDLTGGDYYREVAPGLIGDIEALLRALAARDGGGE